jgi:hypothetical protein
VLQHATLCFDVVDVQEQGFLTTEDVSQFLTWRNALNDVHKADIDYEVNVCAFACAVDMDKALHVPFARVHGTLVMHAEGTQNVASAGTCATVARADRHWWFGGGDYPSVGSLHQAAASISAHSAG